MAEPNSAVAAGIAAGALVSVPAPLFGLDVPALVSATVVSAMVSYTWPAIDDKIKAAVAVAFSGYAAGFAAPVVAAVLAAKDASLLGAVDGIKMVAALGIGAAGPTVTPVALAALKSAVSAFGKRGG